MIMSGFKWVSNISVLVNENHNSNSILNSVAFCLSLVISLQWIGSAIKNGLHREKVPAFGSNPQGYAQTIGPVMLNLAFTTVVPSWVNIKVKRQ